MVAFFRQALLQQEGHALLVFDYQDAHKYLTNMLAEMPERSLKALYRRARQP